MVVDWELEALDLVRRGEPMSVGLEGASPDLKPPPELGETPFTPLWLDLLIMPLALLPIKYGAVSTEGLLAPLLLLLIEFAVAEEAAVDDVGAVVEALV